MRRKQSIIVLLVVLVVLTAIASVLLVNYQRSQNSPFGPRPVRVNPGDIEVYYMARTVISTINIVLLAVLIANYVSLYIKTKSEFTVGLLLFALMLLIKDITMSPFVIVLGGFGLFGLGPFAVMPDIFELVALLVLFYLSVKY